MKMGKTMGKRFIMTALVLMLGGCAMTSLGVQMASSVVTTTGRAAKGTAHVAGKAVRGVKHTVAGKGKG